MEAAAIEPSFPSPPTSGVWGRSIPGIVNSEQVLSKAAVAEHVSKVGQGLQMGFVGIGRHQQPESHANGYVVMGVEIEGCLQRKESGYGLVYAVHPPVGQRQEKGVSWLHFIGGAEFQRGASPQVGMYLIGVSPGLLAGGNLGDLDLRVSQQKPQYLSAGIA